MYLMEIINRLDALYRDTAHVMEENQLGPGEEERLFHIQAELSKISSDLLTLVKGPFA